MNTQLLHLKPGHVIRVHFPFFTHVGLLTGRHMNGEPSVLSFSQAARGLREQPLSEFVGQRQWVLEGYPGQLPAHEVLRRAWSQQHRPYSLLGFNCEHFIRFAHGLHVESPQVQFAVALATVGGLLAMTSR